MPAANTESSGNPLISSLHHPGCYPHPAADVQLLETHISWVLLAGEFAYKIKKPVNLGFLDFSTLEQRQHYCHEELRLNRRFAAQLYLDCVPITGDARSPKVDGDGPAIEYAVRMCRFPQQALASQLLAAGQLLPQHIEAFAALLAEAHRTAARTAADSPWGAPAAVLDAAQQNIDVLASQFIDPADAAAITALRTWILHEHDVLRNFMAQRQAAGAVRECHGDLHLGNIVLIDNRLLPFDCIEFNPALRWNDVLSEAAFLVMDLHDRGSPRLAWLFLNSYLEDTQDYEGLALLPFHLVYRAMVRAKVHGLRATQPGLDPGKRASLLQASRTYLALAGKFAHRPHPALIITHGLSGSGKSRIAGELMQQCGAIRIRSDVERKRQHGLAPQDRSAGTVGGGIYSNQATAALYRHLAGLAQTIISAGCTAIIDAAFLQHWQRDLLRDVARAAGIPFLIMAVKAPEAVIRAQIRQREAAGNDPSDAGMAVLEHQLKTIEPLTAAERATAVELSVDGRNPDVYCQQVIRALAALQTTRQPD